MDKIHTLSLNSRKNVEITGVTDVGTYSDDTVEVDTVNGCMIIDGEDLSITKLDVESGILALVGRIDSISYTDVDKPRAHGIFQRIFK